MNQPLPPSLEDNDAAVELTREPKVPYAASTLRWVLGTALMASMPVVASLLGGARRGGNDAMAPTNVNDLVLFSAIHCAFFGFLWGICWLLARPNKEQLRMRFNSLADIGWGMLYSVGMRIGVGIFIFFIFVMLGILGFDVDNLSKIMKSDGETIQKTFAPAFQASSPLYKFLMFTLVSFVVAGLVEELWRTFTMAGLERLGPASWRSLDKKVVALFVSSVLFGLGHVYQGATGVVLTTFLGFLLGSITLYHRSIWPAVIAHGCFDAASFMGLAAMK